MAISGNDILSAFRHNNLQKPATVLANAFRVSDWTLYSVDPDGLMYVSKVWVWTRWFIILACFVVLVYRPGPAYLPYGTYVPLFLTMVVFNIFLHYRLATNRMTTWRWVLASCAVDTSLVIGCIVVAGGFSHYFFHLLLYPVLAAVAVTISSLRLNLAWVTAVAVIYLAISLLLGDGIDTDVREEKPLFIRIIVMYAVTISVNLVSSYERARWREAVDRERDLQRDRIALSQNLHDTLAQSAYMMGLGLDTAREMADESNEKLQSTLQATSLISQTVIWELRHPIDIGRIFEGRELGRTLKSHAATFTAITSIPAKVTQQGAEPELSIDTRSQLFSIAHNALTNAFRHAQATEVLIELDYESDTLRLSISDNGVGLPEDYEERGHGFANMRKSAERLGGRLIVVPRNASGGASVSCLLAGDGAR